METIRPFEKMDSSNTALLAIDVVNSCAHERCESKKYGITFSKIRKMVPKLTAFVDEFRKSVGGMVIFTKNVPWRKEYLPESINELYEDTMRDLIFIPARLNSDNRIDINGTAITGAWKSGFNMSGNSLPVNGPLEIEDTDVEIGWTEFGMRGHLTNNENDEQSTFTIIYPKSQSFGYLNVYGTKQLNIITTDNTLKTKSQNLILIGNACTNTLIATLLKKPTPCDKDLEEDTGILHLTRNPFDTTKNILIISGKTDQDVINALTVLIDHKRYALEGNKFTIQKQQQFLVIA